MTRTLYYFARANWSLSLSVNWRDLWLGVRLHRGTRFDVWVCLVPMLPIHFSVVREPYRNAGEK
jgi:hypothetical protein